MTPSYLLLCFISKYVGVSAAKSLDVGSVCNTIAVSIPDAMLVIVLIVQTAMRKWHIAAHSASCHTVPSIF